MWGSRGVAPLILNLSTGWRPAFNTPPTTVFPLNRGLIGSQTQFVLFEGVENLELPQGTVSLSEILNRIDFVV